METGLTRIVLALALLPLVLCSARADGRCDLNDVIGYQIVFGKPILGYIEGGDVVKSYDGCQPDRVLVFVDHTGVRCSQTVAQHSTELPTAYLFARGNSDLKLCVDGELFNVQRTN